MKVPNICSLRFLAGLQSLALPLKAALFLMVPGPGHWQPQSLEGEVITGWLGRTGTHQGSRVGASAWILSCLLPCPLPWSSPPVALSCVSFWLALSSLLSVTPPAPEPLSPITSLPSSLETLALSLPSPQSQASSRVTAMLRPTGRAAPPGPPPRLPAAPPSPSAEPLP